VTSTRPTCADGQGTREIPDDGGYARYRGERRRGRVGGGHLYYTDWRGFDRDIDQGKTASEIYYAPDRLAIPVASLKKMYDVGVVHDIRRS
jgi:hypothetical protein